MNYQTWYKITQNQLVILKEKCKCGGNYIADTSRQLLSLPAKYSCKCNNCGDVKYIFTFELEDLKK